MGFDRRLFNVFLVGLAFMFTFMAFQTMGNIETTILDSVHQDDPTFTGRGYTSLAIIYAVMSVCNWVAPSIIAVIGPKWSMVVGALTYLLFIMSFLKPLNWFLYFASAVIGVGAALIWTGQGNYLTLNSTNATIARNSGIFWAMLQCSMFFGNLFVFIKFAGASRIEEHSRKVVIWVLSALGIVGTGIFVLLPRPPEDNDLEGEVRIEKPHQGPIQVFKEALKLFFTPRMLLLNITFFYTGIELGFYSGVYSSAVGFTKAFSEPKKLVGLSGVFIGVGEVVGGGVFGIFGSRTTKYGRDPIVIGGFILHIISFFLIFINLPNSSPFHDTDEKAFIHSSEVLAMACSLMLGLGDACFNTQIYSTLGSVFADNSAAAFAIFKFTQSVAAAACFFYASALCLYGQIGILIGLSIVGTIAYVIVEWQVKKEKALSSNSDVSINSIN